MKDRHNNRRGFTLVELLVVIGIISLLLSILLPTVNRARESARATVCSANLKQIAFAVQAYCNDNKGILHMAPDRWQWVTTAPPVQLIQASSSSAYWGVAYLPYISSPAIYSKTGDVKATVYAAARKVFNCPSEILMSPAFGNTDPATPGHYGANFCVTGKFPSTRWAKIGRYKNPAETIFCHDSVEQRLDGSATYVPDTAGNMLSSFGNPAGNLLQWRPGGEATENYLPGSTRPVWEYYRHNRRCQVLWLDGHVSSIAYSDGSDVPAAWYWGQSTRPN